MKAAAVSRAEGSEERTRNDVRGGHGPTAVTYECVHGADTGSGTRAAHAECDGCGGEGGRWCTLVSNAQRQRKEWKNEAEQTS